MELSSLAIDLNTLAESGTALWATVGAAGIIAFINVLTFIKTTVSGKKFAKLSDFAVVADQSIKFAKNEMISAKDKLVDETRKQIVEPFKEMVQALVSDNSQLASLTVSLLSFIPLPLEVKKDAVAVIGKLGNITDEAKALLVSSILHQEKILAVEIAQSTKLQENIDKI